MKKIEWENPNKMKIDTAHKTFNRQTQLIGTGNVIANTQLSFYIRAWNTTALPAGGETTPGYLQNYDLGMFNNLPGYVRESVKGLAIDESVILYEFRHFTGYDQKNVHGYVITDKNYNFLEAFLTGPTQKSESVIAECIKYITN